VGLGSDTHRRRIADGEVDRKAFEEFFRRYQGGLGRLAFLLTGELTAAEDLTADVFMAVWRQWATVSTVDTPLAYVRRIMVNTAASRARRLTREQRRIALVHAGEVEALRDADRAGSLDVRAALLRLPIRRRACVVLRHAFDLSEAETAHALGVSIGTVKSQTSKAVAQLQRLLTEQDGSDR
jgi:RNA polymerase sigma-70 factor (sigma-E family)